MNHSVLPDGGWMRKLGMFIRLAVRLFVDRCVPFHIKLLPVLALGYVLSPDLLDGPFDDLIVLGLCIYLFIVCIPEDIINKHKQQISEELWMNYQVDPPSTPYREDKRSIKR